VKLFDGLSIEITILKKLLTTACLFVVTAVAIVSFIALAVFGQETRITALQAATITPCPGS
jgi:hypothetical protein